MTVWHSAILPTYMKCRIEEYCGERAQMSTMSSDRVSSADDGSLTTIPFLTEGLRPFFLAAGLWAVVALSIWVAFLQGYITIPSRFDPLSWHIHEMLFGFVMAAVAGFLLTAIPNWTRRLPVSGSPLAWLAGLWLAGRLASFFSQALPFWLAVAADLAFPLALAAVVAREIIGARNRRNMPMIAPVLILSAADLLMHLEAHGFGVERGLGWRLALAAILVLVSVIGGRIIPSFTHNWLVARGAVQFPQGHGYVDSLALGTLHAGLFLWAFQPGSPLAGGLLILAGLVNGWRLSCWHGGKTLSEPLLFMLHIGYGWLCAGAVLLGAAVLHDAVPVDAGIHSMTVGVIGIMILAVMTRASRGHTGRELSADRATGLIYAFALLAAIVRTGAAFLPQWTTLLLMASAGLWIAGFGTFVIFYGPVLMAPRLRRP